MVAVLLGGCGDRDSGPGAEPGTEPGSDSAANRLELGERIYNRSCFSCHAAGVADAPIPGDAEAWEPRVAKGRELLLKSVKEGMPPGMPAMGLCLSCSDDELAAVLEYMLAQ